MERCRRRLDGLGTKTWQTIGAEPIAARSRRYVVSWRRTSRSICSEPLTMSSRSIRIRGCPTRREETHRHTWPIRSTALLDYDARRVTRGYGVLQPRVSVSLASAVALSSPASSRTAADSIHIAPPFPMSTRICSAKATLRAKASTTSTLSRPLLTDAFPANHILSHDLIEGCFARVGPVTDVELFDEYPTRFDADAERQHRWVRGDWQLLPWLMPTVPRGRTQSKSAYVACPLEDLRQSAAQPRAAGVDCAVDCRLVCRWPSVSMALPRLPSLGVRQPVAVLCSSRPCGLAEG